MGVLEALFDQGTGGNCHKWRHYFEIYERYFGKFVNKRCTYLEIGVQRGGSLAIMSKYLGRDARIIGVDVDPSCTQLRQHGFEIHVGDQADSNFLGDIGKRVGSFDMILDDGGHTADQQLSSFFALFPHLAYGGVYIVEDLHAHFWQSQFQESRFGINFYDFAKGLADKMTLWHVDQRSFARFQQPPERRGPPFVIGNFAVNQIFGIHFYDSMIVFEKRAIAEPYSQQK